MALTINLMAPTIEKVVAKLRTAQLDLIRLLRADFAAYGVPKEAVAALVSAAVDSNLGSWDANKALSLWDQLRFRKDTISVSAARWATGASDTAARARARNFMMKHHLVFMEAATMTPSLTRRTARDWVSRTENFLSLLREAAAEEERAARTAA